MGAVEYWRKRRQTSIPLLSGKPMSRTIRSGSLSSVMVRASYLVAATIT